MVPVSNFDFLVGKWSVINRRLPVRLANCTEWQEFRLDFELTALMGGLANVDRMFGEVEEQYFEGVTFRIFDPGKDEWTIHCADTRHPELVENVRGRFTDGVGIFYGMEAYRGSRYLMRFIWKSLSATEARWEQAFFDPANLQWETNWTMDFAKASSVDSRAGTPVEDR